MTLSYKLEEFLCEVCLRYYPTKCVGSVWVEKKHRWIPKNEWGNWLISLRIDYFKCLNCSALHSNLSEENMKQRVKFEKNEYGSYIPKKVGDTAPTSLLFFAMLAGCLGSIGVLWWAINFIVTNGV